MSDDETDALSQEGGRKRFGCGPLVFVVSVVYPLSIGPVFGLTGGPFSDSRVVAQGFMLFYWPVILVAELIPSLGDALEWYVAFFG